MKVAPDDTTQKETEKGNSDSEQGKDNVTKNAPFIRSKDSIVDTSNKRLRILNNGPLYGRNLPVKEFCYLRTVNREQPPCTARLQNFSVFKRNLSSSLFFIPKLF